MIPSNNTIIIPVEHHSSSSSTVAEHTEKLRTPSQTSDPKSTTEIDDVDDEERAVSDPPPAATTENQPALEDISEGLSNPGWLSVISLFLVNFCVLGVTFSWGIMQNVYLTEVYAGKTNEFSISFVGTISGTLVVCTGILVTPLTQIIGTRNTMLIGAILCPAALVCASFANELWQIYLSEGLLFGIGGSLVWASSVYLPAQWFSRNRALASGLGVCGTGIGGLVLSLVTQALLAETGYRMTLRYLGIICFVLLMAACVLARPRFPRTGLKSATIIDRSLITTDFVIFMCYGFMVIISYVTPFFLLPEFGATFGVNSSQAYGTVHDCCPNPFGAQAYSFIFGPYTPASIIIGVMAACNAVCRIVIGYLADRFGRINATFTVTFLAGFFMMVVWVQVKSLASLYVFGVLYGLTGGAFVSLFPAVAAELVPVQKIQQGVSLAFISMTLGGIFGTPISGLIKEHAGFTAAIEFSGATTIASSVILLYLRQRRSHGKIFCKV
ncbi:hypothetical protein Unana1_07400 [Umbelopsis nana]